MKNTIFTGLLLFLGFVCLAQSPIGTWKTIDDETGEAKSHVEIYETSSGKLEGKVIKILTPGKEAAKCENCSGDLKNRPIKGMVILRDLEKKGNEWKNGYILDPNNGKEYKSKMSLKDDNTLEVRGYIGISLIGRTQTWERIK